MRDIYTTIVCKGVVIHDGTCTDTKESRVPCSHACKDATLCDRIGV